MKKNSFAAVLSVAACYLYTAGVLASVPFVGRIVAALAPAYAVGSREWLTATVCLYCCVPFALAALVSLRLLLRLVTQGRVFSAASCRLLLIIVLCAFSVAVIFVFMAKYFTSTVFVCAAAAFLALCLLVVRDVIAKGCEIKSENDLTV